MPQFNRSTSREAAFVKALTERMERKLPGAFTLPMRQTDPPESQTTNLWMRADGRLRGRYWNGSAYVYVDYPLRGDISGPPAVPSAPAVPTPTAQPITRQSLYTATWSQAYKGDDTKRTDNRGEFFLGYGDEGEGSGVQKSLVGFNYATIVSDLTASTIKAVELRMTNYDCYWESGVDIAFGMHNVTAEPTTWPATASLPLRRATSGHFGKGDTRTVPLTLQFGQLLRAGTAKGLAVEAQGAARDYWGYAAGVGSGYTPPQLIVTYIK